jgi:transcriptional regulator with XRE-family HTH domain
LQVFNNSDTLGIVMNVRAVGAYIREQRKNARLSLRKMSGLAGVSIPYLSQIERGLRKPSADILQAIARGLRISAETLYVQAGMLEDRAIPDVASAIMSDPTITQRQKLALVQIYQAFRDEAGPAKPPSSSSPRKAPSASARKAASSSSARGAPSGRTRAGRGTKLGGGTKSQGLSPHPVPLRSPATNPRKEV